MLANNPKGLTIEEVSKRLGLNRATAAKYLNSMRMSGQAEMRSLGPAKLFYLSNRLPLADLMSLSSDLILILDDGLFIQHVNEAFLGRFGLGLADLKGLRFEQTVLGVILRDVEPERLRHALEGADLVFECEAERAGVVRYYRARALPLVFDAGARGVGLILEDISVVRRYQQELETRVRARTFELERANRALEKANQALEREIEERRRTESRLAASRRTIEQIVETTPNLIYVYRTDTVRLCYVNRNLEAILGYPAAAACAEDSPGVLPLIHPDDRPAVEVHRAILDKARDGEVHEIEFRVRDAKGHFVLLRCRELVFERDDAGRPCRVIGTGEDVTDRRRVQEALRTANRQVQLLNGLTRNDILNQLNLLAASQRSLEGAVQDPAVQEHLDRERSAVEAIRRQITFTREYQHIGAAPPGWQAVGEVVDRALSGLDRRGVAVENGACGVEIFADPLVERVFSSLVDNALRHGGPITTVRFSCWRTEDGLVIACEDDGVGLPEDEKERVFERAYGRNSGYGLYLAREILAITGLSIGETGVPGEGARFEIRVPHGLFRAAPPSV